MIPMIILSAVMIAVTGYILTLLKDTSKNDEYIELLRTKRGQNTVKDRSWRDM